MRGRRVSGVAATGLGRDGSRAYARSAQTASLGEPQWSCVATRMQVSARVEADRVCAAIRQRQKVSSLIGGVPETSPRVLARGRDVKNGAPSALASLACVSPLGVLERRECFREAL